MKVAIVHDFLNQYGGAERVVENIKDIFPEAPIYTTFFDPDNLPSQFKNWEIITPRFLRTSIFRFFPKYFTFLLPFIFESFDFDHYDVIISSTAHFAKNINCTHNQLHICFCHTPPRFLYGFETETDRRKIKILKPILIFLDNYLRLVDYYSSQRVDFFVTNSCNTQRRIQKFYRKDSKVIYPAYKLKKCSYEETKKGEYFLVVSRLAAYKRIDLAVRACNELKKKLVVIGTGKELERLKKIAGGSIIFMGKQEDDVLASYYSNCQAVIFPGEDDFGLVPVEAMGFGKPVIAYGKGGARESIIEGKTGIFFYQPTVDSLKAAIQKFQSQHFSSNDCRNRAAYFGEDLFKRRMKEFVDKKWEEFNAGTA